MNEAPKGKPFPRVPTALRFSTQGTPVYDVTVKMESARGAALTPAHVRNLIRAEMARAGGLRALAKEWHMDAGQLSRLLSEESDHLPPSVLGPLGLRKRVEVWYERDS